MINNNNTIILDNRKFLIDLVSSSHFQAQITRINIALSQLFYPQTFFVHRLSQINTDF